jgi:hypothetical protein
MKTIWIKRSHLSHFNHGVFHTSLSFGIRIILIIIMIIIGIFVILDLIIIYQKPFSFTKKMSNNDGCVLFPFLTI